MDLVSLVLFVIGAAGVVIVAARVWVVRRFLRRAVESPAPGVPRPVSVLKPLCGLDDGLEENLLSFAAQAHPSYEVLLGFRSPDDPARPLAEAMAARFPDRFRVVRQEGEPGLNPKVNQLVTLARAARHDILVVSDASVRVGPGYLAALARAFDDPAVALAVTPTVGTRERSIGSLFDNLHFTTHYTASSIAAKALAGANFVNGKSMALRRADLEALGGFAAVKDHLAEDYVLGCRVRYALRRETRIVPHVAWTVSERRRLRDFVKRYARWAVMQRRAGGIGAYALLLLLYPIIPGLAALLASPSWRALAAFLAIAFGKSLADVAQMCVLRADRPVPLRAAALGPLCDTLVGGAWLYGLMQDSVEWRGRRYAVGPETRIAPPEPPFSVGATLDTPAIEEAAELG